MFSAKTVDTPEQLFENAVLSLAALAESFRSIEVLFMTSHPAPKFLVSLCETILNKGNKPLTFPRAVIYPEYINIHYHYSPEKKTWIKKREEHVIAHDDITSIIHKFCQKLTTFESHHANATRTYFARQRQFYQHAQEEKAEAQENHIQNTEFLTSLISSLKQHSVLLCKSPESAALTIDKLLNRFQKLSETFWQELAVSIFVGRDLLTHNEPLLLQEPIKELIRSIANHCVAQHQKIHASPMSNSSIELSNEELEMILKMRQAKISPG